ncbi:class A beta-lactamase-related serine hydrolase [Bacillus sp. HMF5848]|uniref:serine hydrolase domain-containing protein n=1 Tax=Bacillus sp. HMF5848 TaxID=2495421 RepID=UPI000F7807C5|nr:serine hydrolase domain-containing protein [Bacillus sp. HMF5848]RSK25986.1 class A beta-lactamase-related serine hydrolase [Bacillus sp. HMF5848]
MNELQLLTKKLVERDFHMAKKPSIGMGVVTKDGRLFYGSTHDDMGDISIQDCLFEMGSTTKTFTSLLLAQLVQEGMVSLDDSIISYKPAYKNALSFNGEGVTFRHLSTHSSRLPREDMKTLRVRMKENKDEKDNPYKHFSTDDFNQFFLNHELKKEIGEKWAYSNVGVGLLGNVLADIVGMPYEAAIREYILEPVGMKSTFVTIPEKEMNRFVKAYNKKGERIWPIEIPAMPGAGILKSSLDDMLTYLECQMGLKETPLREAIDLTHHIHGKTSSKKVNMGLGWMVEQKKWSSYPIIHHGGTTMGFHTYCGFIKEKQIGVVIFSTIQLKLSRIIQMLMRLKQNVNEDMAEVIFQKLLEE